MNVIIKYRLLPLLLLLPAIFTGCKKETIPKHNSGVPIVIEKFSPVKGGVGTEVLVYGDNFNNDTTGVRVTVNGVKAAVTGVVQNRLVFMVPDGAGSGKINITIGGNTVTSTEDFNYVAAQYVSTLAGSGQEGFRDGEGAAAMFAFQLGQSIATDAAGNVYVCDAGNSRIRKITHAGEVSTVAGNGTGGWQDGPAASAMFNHPYGIEVDKDNNLYVADTWNAALRKITPEGVVSTLAWIGDITDVVVDKRNGDIYASQFGPGTIVKVNGDGSTVTVGSGFQQLGAIAMDSKGNFYGVDNSRSFIGKVDAATKNMTIIAGVSGQTGLEDGPGNTAKFDRPWGIDIDKEDNLYIAGNGGPNYGGGDNNTNHCIRFIKAGTWEVSTFAGGSSKGYNDGLGSLAVFRSPTGVALDAAGAVYVLVEGNQRIRIIISR